MPPSSTEADRPPKSDGVTSWHGREHQKQKGVLHLFLTDEFTAGLVLSGSEIKSIRAGKASITEGYCRFDAGELWVHNMYVAEYANAGYMPQDRNESVNFYFREQSLKSWKRR